MTSTPPPRAPGEQPSGNPRGNDPHHLERFLEAQATIYPQVQEELRLGRKSSHWMWFVFPQLRGLGRSATAEFFGIASVQEARAYLEHPVLGLRLRECTRRVTDAVAGGRTTRQIFGSPDDLKLHSCLTLFAAASSEPLFVDALRAVFGGETDVLTVERLTPR